MASGADVNLDAVDLALLDAMNKHPRAGALELSRQVKVARATVQAALVDPAWKIEVVVTAAL